MINPQEPIPSQRRITRTMQKAKQVQVEHEKEKEARVPNFQGMLRKFRKSSNSSIGIDPNQNKLYDYINEKEERDKNLIYEEIKDDDNPTYQQKNDLSFEEDQELDHEDEEEYIPEVPIEKESSPMKELVEQGEQKSKRKIKKLKDKIKTFKVLERFLKNENALLKERNHTLISENEKLKEDKDHLQEEHGLVFHQAYLWNKSRKAPMKQNWKL